jgi:predicted metal-dependent phosphoesterase TrpH
MNFFVDLHTHSTASDGTDSPSALVEKAAQQALAAVALTDHDTVSGLAEAVEAGQRFSLEVVRGCEIAVATPYGEAHILGLWLPEKLPHLTPALEKWRFCRLERNRLMAEKLTAAGMPVTHEEILELAGGDSVGRPHIAALMVKKSFVSSPQEAFSKYLADGKPLYVPRELPSPPEGLAKLQMEKATTVLAHPMLLRAPRKWLDGFVAELARLGLDALEAYHSDHAPEDIRRSLMLAERYGLALSGGSDYHGEVRGGVVLGRGRGGMRVPVELMEKLKHMRRAKGLPVYNKE